MSFSRLRLFLVAAVLAIATSGCVISIAPPQPPLLGTPAGAVPAAPTSSVTPTSISSALPGAPTTDAVHLEVGIPVWQAHADALDKCQASLEFYWANHPDALHVDVMYDSHRGKLTSTTTDQPDHVKWSSVADTSVPGFDTRVMVDADTKNAIATVHNGTLLQFTFQLTKDTGPMQLRPVQPREAARKTAFYELVEGGFERLADKAAGKPESRLREAVTDTDAAPQLRGKPVPTPAAGNPQVLWE